MRQRRSGTMEIWIAFVATWAVLELTSGFKLNYNYGRRGFQMDFNVDSNEVPSNDEGLTFTLVPQNQAGERRGASFPYREPEDQDDMIMSDEQWRDFEESSIQTRNGLTLQKYRWPKGQVYYEIDSSFSSSDQRVIMQAIYHIQNKTCIRFLPKTDSTTDYVLISNEMSGCSANVGRIGGEQSVNLGRGCVYRGIVVHELVHAIGFRHEQCRSDRDDYVTINWNNIPASRQRNFLKYNSSQVTAFGIAYDYESVMHYGGFDFAANRSVPTIIPKNPKVKAASLGNDDGLTALDAAKINRMYKGICA